MPSQYQTLAESAENEPFNRSSSRALSPACAMACSENLGHAAAQGSSFMTGIIRTEAEACLSAPGLRKDAADMHG